MKTQKVLPFSQLGDESQWRAGGKGGALAKLYQAGYPVPDGFVVMPAAFDGDKLTTDSWEMVSANLAQLQRGGENAQLAVRSSALSEDSAQASFAGEFETILNVGTGTEIREAIHQVRRSRHSQRVAAYSQAQGMDARHEIAVVVQRMVQPEISGILFTADPVTGSQATMAGNFVHGLGEQLVSGEATGETFTLARPYGRYHGPPELRRYGRQLYKLASRLEKDLGSPQDIEWAIANGKLCLLQSRPITTLQGHNPATGEWNATLTGDYLWSNVNFGEAITDVMTPLSWSVLKLILEEWVFIPGYASVGNIGGRPYLNISVFASVFFASGRNRGDFLETLEGTLHMQLPDEMEMPVIPLSRRAIIAALFNLAHLQLRQKQAVKRLPIYLQTNLAWFKNTQQQLRETDTKAGLLALWQEQIRPHVTQAVWGILGSAISASDYAIQLRRDLTELVGPDDADTLISNLSDQSGMLASLGLVAGIAQVANGRLDREAYWEQYGHRGPHEFELSVPRPVENPDWLEQQLAQFAASPVDVEEMLARQRAEFDAAWERFRTRFPRKAKSMKRRIDEMGRRARRREKGRSEYVRDRWLMRLFALRAGELTGLGEDIFFLASDEVVRALSDKETAVKHIPARKQTYEKYKALPPYPSAIRGRFDPFQWAADPQRRSDVYDAQSPLESAAKEPGDANVIVGAPGAAGRVEAVVRRLDDPADGEKLQAGEVLVTTQTDIAWTTLFPRAAAIVTDVGAPLSHAAIVARELGIPAVVGCGNATMWLKTGDRVRVDGGNGIVEVLAGE